jgi:signal transduction histidine kinase/HAMP domain-containing protein
VRTFRGRLLGAFLLAFLLPAALLWLVMDAEIRQIRSRALGIARTQKIEALRDDVALEVRNISRRLEEKLRLFEEAGADLAAESGRLMAAGAPADSRVPAAGAGGLVASPTPEDGTVAWIARGNEGDPEVRRLYARTRRTAAALGDLLVRRPEIRSVYLLTRGGVFRGVPWFDPFGPEAARHAGLFDIKPEYARRWAPVRPPPAPPDPPHWTDPYSEKIEAGDWVVTAAFPIRDASGRVFASLQLDVPVARLVSLPPSRGGDPVRRCLVTTSGALLAADEEGLQWHQRILSADTEPESRRLRAEILRPSASRGRYRLAGHLEEVFASPAAGTNWLAVGAFRDDRVTVGDAETRYRVDALGWQGAREATGLIFLVLAGISLAGLIRFSRSLSEPLSQLSRAADAVKEGRPSEVAGALPGSARTAEVAGLTDSFRAMAGEVQRRIETLSRLGDLTRRAGATLDFSETLSRITEIIAGFFSVKGCWIHLYNARERRLETVFPGVGLTAEDAASLVLPAGPGSLEGAVFQTGEPRLSNDLPRDPAASARLVKRFKTINAMCVPLRSEEESLGVLTLLNRPGGFTLADLEAAVAFAHVAGILLRRVLLYRELEETVAELKRANYLKEHFLQNVSHELRTPLTSILGWSEMLSEPEKPPRVLEAGIRQIRQAGTSLLMLIDDLLDLSRLERGGFRLNRERLRAADVVGRAVETVQALASSRGIALAAVRPDADTEIEADPLRLQQVLWNLLNNSIKFSQKGSSVKVGFEPGLDAVLFYVEDDGIGIPPADLPHVFERFRQADGSVTRGSPGMGIGLSIAKTIVEMHGGEIWAKSDPGRGSRFSFTIPRKPREAPAQKGQ